MKNSMEHGRAGIYSNKDFVFVQTWSSIYMDPAGKQFYFDHTSSDEALGEALLNALMVSRAGSGELQRELGGRGGKSELFYKDWVTQTMAKFGYKTKRAMFRYMSKCGVSIQGGTIRIRPSHHVKTEAWDGDGITEKDHVLIPFDSPPAEIGAALRLALSRCR
jgi:hypothetical protein